MAKRKRLTPAALTETAASPAPLETKALYPMGVAPSAAARAPIAQVAGDTAAHAALEELADEVADARASGRLVQALPLSDIRADHLLRDRMVSNREDMDALKTSLQARGQQTPIEVVELDEGGYGLISGFRRLTALQELLEETGEAGFGRIQALIKPKDSISDSYLAMVEENEIRADLSFYERARLAGEAARIGVYPTAERAVQALFANAPSAKRSKIKTFLRIHDRLGGVLRFPAAIPEKLGLALSKALETDAGFEARVKDALRRGGEDQPSERAALERALKQPSGKAQAAAQEVVAGVAMQVSKGRLILSGAGVTEELALDVADWLARR